MTAHERAINAALEMYMHLHGCIWNLVALHGEKRVQRALTSIIKHRAKCHAHNDRKVK